jgi:hypothetical protein
MNISSREALFPPVIDATMRSDFASCPRRFYYRHILGLSPSGGANIHLTAGAAYAKGLEAFRLSFYTGEALDIATAKGILAIIREYGDPDFGEGNAKAWDAVIDAFLSYLINWPPASDYIQPLILADKPTVEFSFVLPIHSDETGYSIRHPQSNDPLLYCGRFDMIGRMNDTLFGLDDKTTSALGAYWSSQWELRSQFTGYTWGAAEFGHNLAGFIIRGTAILKTKITHAEAIVYRPQFVLDRWRRRLRQSTREMVDSFILEEWPHTGEENGTCSSYGGCPFVSLCTSPTPDAWIDGNFIVDRWDPTHGAGEVK